MFVNINRGAYLPRLKEGTECPVLWSGLVSRVGSSHRVNLMAFHCICEKVLPTNDVPISFADFCFVSRNHWFDVLGYENDKMYQFHHTYQLFLLLL